MLRFLSVNYIVGLIALALGVYHLVLVSGLHASSTMEIRLTHLMLVAAVLLLTRPSTAGLKGSRVDLIVSILLALSMAAASIYLLSRWKEIAYSGGLTNQLDYFAGIVIVVIVFEIVRRGVSVFLMLITAVFFLYPFVSPFLPGLLQSRGYSFQRIIVFLTTDTQGVYGIPLGVAASYIIMFTIFGAFLNVFGAGEFFFEISRRLTSNMRAAGAKTAVVFSTLLGMISGSAAGNVAVTGTLTIPMMKKEGYEPHQAGAIEAVVSTGGQIMPPVMGAAAFIMAEIIGTPYTNIMKAALLPALLFFVSIFFVVHLQAVKRNITIAPADESDSRPTARVLLDGARFIVPFVTLLGMILWGYSPFKASFWAIILLLIGDIVWRRGIDRDFMTNTVAALIDGAKSVAPISAACAAAGIISGVLAISGLGPKIATMIYVVSGGVPLIALVLTMIAAIILGMGLPTTAAYLILATVVAPGLVKLGVPLLTAHFFVFFYGCISTITPPVALASYVAAGIAGAEINKVSWTAFGYGICSYILPFMFFFGPALMMDASAPVVAISALTALSGTFAIAAAVVGCLSAPIGIFLRLGIFVSGVLLLHQGLATDIAGIAILGAGWLISRRQARNPARG